MKKLQSIVRDSLMGMVLVGGLGVTQQAWALGVGQCWPSKGSPHPYNFNFTRNITEPFENVKDHVVEDAANGKWQGGGEYQVDCECDTSGRMNESYISGVSLIGGNYDTYKGWNYYPLAGTEGRLAVATTVHIGGGQNVQKHVPFSMESNLWTSVNQECTNTRYASGSTGTVNLRFLKPFVGETEIPPVTFLAIYISSSKDVKSTNPVATVSMSGKVTVKQSCVFTPPSISIAFGDIMADSFKVAPGQKPVGFKGEYSTTVAMDCGNISEGVIVSLALKGESNAHITDALKTISTEDGTENEDVAIRFVDKDGKIIKPSVSGIEAKEGLLSVSMTGLGELVSKGITEFTAYPISATGQSAKVGEFTATATLDVQLE
ncbi:fimbrial protein [Serratia silvae]|uniref:Fimbrial protein n=1 Tax=Serratia silvae TaxID=2824122 RepID=A0ABT0KI32_9GAMM|nr:fimbrial protein [Serratia silvae]MCL1031688.1 fimbrial protein [Serratia silvae]